MVAASNTFEGGSDETTISTANSGGSSGDAFDAVFIGTSATLVFDNARAAHGSFSARVATGGTSTTSRFDYQGLIGTQSTIFLRIYLFITAAPAANHRLFQALSSSTLRAAILLTSGGVLRSIDAASATIQTMSTTVATNQWVRVEAKIVGHATTGQVEVKLFNTADSQTPTETITSSANQNTGGSMDVYRFGLGANIANAGPFWLDGVRADSVDYPGPYNLDLAPANAAHAQTAGNLALTQDHQLVVAAAAHAQAADSLALTQTHVLAVANATHGQSAGNVTLEYLAALVIANAAHAQTAGAVTITATLVTLEETFEGVSPLGNFDAVSAGRLTVQAASSLVGAQGLQFTPAASTAFARWRERIWIGGAAFFPYWSARFYVRLPGSLPGTPPPSIFAAVTVGGSDDFTFFYNPATGTWKWDLDQGDNDESGLVIADRWYLIEAKGQFAADPWTASVKVDGVEQGTISTAGNGTEVVHNLLWGVATSAQTWTADMDAFKAQVSTAPLDYLGPADVTAAATINPSTDPALVGGVQPQTAALVGTIS